MRVEIIRDFANENGQGVVDIIARDRSSEGLIPGTYLTVGGETAFQIGYYGCDTCSYLFSKVGPAQRLTEGVTPDVAARLSAALQDVQEMPKPAALAEFGAILAPGNYSVVLPRLSPELVLPGGPRDYFSNEVIDTWGLDALFAPSQSPGAYYRLGSVSLGRVDYGGERLGVVLGVPLYPPTSPEIRNEQVIESYRAVLREGEKRPTALALGRVDERGPADWQGQGPEFTRHTIVTLFVLDGHHKLAAAAAEGLPIQILVFLPHIHGRRPASRLVAAIRDLLSGISRERRAEFETAEQEVSDTGLDLLVAASN